MENATPFGVLPEIPEPRLRQVENDTPFAHLAFDKMGKGRLFYDVVVCKASFALASGPLQITGKALPIEPADRYWDEENAATSSLRVAGDVLLTKPGADLFITGSARSLDDKPLKDWHAGVRLSQARQTLVEHKWHLIGPRFWQHGLLRGWTMSDTQPTNAVALRHEHAYGGHYQKRHPKKNEDPLKTFAANPAGCGYWDPDQLDKNCSHPVPQIETLGVSVTKMGADYPLVAPSPIARFWADRTRYGGTYDETWRAQYHASPIPDFPTDFDPRFFQCAHPNLICPQPLRGDETLALAGVLVDEQALFCTLPGFRLRAELIAADGRGGERDMLLDTVHVDLDSQTVALTWRLTLDQRACIEHVRLSQSAILPAGAP